MTDQKKVIIFDDKMFYNARHLYEYLDRYYYSVHKVTYLQVEDATGKKLASIDKFFKIKYEYVDKTTKLKIKRYNQIKEGYEEIVAIENKTVDDFLIRYLGAKEVGYLFTYKTPKKELYLAFKVPYLRALLNKYNENLSEIYLQKIINESIIKNGYYHYPLKPTSIKQNIF